MIKDKKKKKRKRGFTLFELLAVIVILGVIMLIAIPSIAKVISNSKKNSFVSSGKIYLSSAKTRYAARDLEGTSWNISEFNDGNYDKSPINNEYVIAGKIELKNNDLVFTICEADPITKMCVDGGYIGFDLNSQSSGKDLVLYNNEGLNNRVDANNSNIISVGGVDPKNGGTCIDSTNENACEPGTDIKFKVNSNDNAGTDFNVIYDRGDILTLQTVAAYGPTLWDEDHQNGAGVEDILNKVKPSTLLKSVDDVTGYWDNVITQNYTIGENLYTISTSGYTVMYPYGITNWESNKNKYIYKLERNNVKARVITAQEAQWLGCTTVADSCYSWIANGTSILTLNYATNSTYGYASVFLSGSRNRLSTYEPSKTMNFKPVIDINKKEIVFN